MPFTKFCECHSLELAIGMDCTVHSKTSIDKECEMHACLSITIFFGIMFVVIWRIATAFDCSTVQLNVRQ